MKSFITPLAFVAVLAGCAELRPINPTGDTRGEIARVYVTVEALARQVGQAQLAGYIDTDEEDRLLQMLETAVIATEVVEASTTDGHADEKLGEIRIILESVRQGLKAEGVR